jgi:membrane protease YdiL (CAAX protease family)
VDFWLTMSFYFVFGVFAAWVTLKDNGLELALGMHAANNIYASIFANYSKGALQTQAFFTTNELDALYNLVATLVSMLVFYTIFFRPGKSAKKPAAEAVLEQNK